MESKVKKTLKVVSLIRANNNILWMKLLEIALTKCPKESSAIVRKITANDRRISAILEKSF